MSKQMKSYRLDESDIFDMKDISEALDITETDLIRLMLHAFQEYGICDALEYKQMTCSAEERARYKGVNGLQKLIDKSNKDQEIQNEIKAQIYMAR